MTANRKWVVVVQSSLLGLLFAVALSGDEVISVEVWVAATAASMVVLMLRELIAVAAVEPARLVPAWSQSRQQAATREARGLRRTYLLLANAQRSRRTHANHLRPRLVELANHYLPRSHGLDLENDQERVADLLGDVAWLVDSAVVDRTPTTADLQRFLDIMFDEQGSVPR